MSPYETITGRRFDPAALSPSEKKLFTDLMEVHGRNPDWVEFSGFWQELLKKILSKISPKERTQHTLYKIAQDLEMRLGIAQGAVAEPDYRDYLSDRIKEKYGSRYRFCREAEIPDAFLSQVLSGKKDFSMDTLRRALKALDLGLALLPTSELAKFPMSNYSALQQVCAVIKGELASLESIRDHLQRTKTAKRWKALLKETSMFQGALDEVLSEVRELPEKERDKKVFEIINKKEADLDTLLSFLRSRLAALADDATTEQRRERSLPTL